MSEEPAVRTTAAPAEGQPARKKPLALGRGLGALLGEVRREEPLVGGASSAGEAGAAAGRTAPAVLSGLASLPISAIAPDPTQPRKHFDDDALEQLASSIAARGVIQPVIVRPLDGGRYLLVAGERRWRAAQKAQLHEIPALVRDLTEREVMAIALIENLQREDLNPIEEARAYHRLAESQGMTQADIARMVDKSRSHVANFQRLLSLPEPVVTLVETGALSMGHARALIGHDNAAELAHTAVERQLSVREVEKLARRKPRDVSPTRKARENGAASNADILAVQNHLEEFLGLSIRITADADPASGTVSIRYKTLDQLDLICQRLTGGNI